MWATKKIKKDLDRLSLDLTRLVNAEIHRQAAYNLYDVVDFTIYDPFAHTQPQKHTGRISKKSLSLSGVVCYQIETLNGNTYHVDPDEIIKLRKDVHV